MVLTAKNNAMVAYEQRILKNQRKKNLAMITSQTIDNLDDGKNKTLEVFTKCYKK